MIDRAFARIGTQSAKYMEEQLLLLAPDADKAKNAEALLPLIRAELRAAFREFKAKKTISLRARNFLMEMNDLLQHQADLEPDPAAAILVADRPADPADRIA